MPVCALVLKKAGSRANTLKSRKIKASCGSLQFTAACCRYTYQYGLLSQNVFAGRGRANRLWQGCLPDALIKEFLSWRKGFSAYRGRMEYVCLDCGARHPGDSLLYTCPQCGGVFLLENLDFDKLKERSGASGAICLMPALPAAALRFGEYSGFTSCLPPCLKKTTSSILARALRPSSRRPRPCVTAWAFPLPTRTTARTPSASFKDRGMACAFSYLKWRCRCNKWGRSADRALYKRHLLPLRPCTPVWAHPSRAWYCCPTARLRPSSFRSPLAAALPCWNYPACLDDRMKVVGLLAETIAWHCSIPRTAGASLVRNPTPTKPPSGTAGT